MKVYSIKVWKYLSRISLPFRVCGTADMDLKLQPWADIIPSTRCWIGLPLSPFSMALPGHPVCSNHGAPLQLWSWPQSTGSHSCLGLIWSTSQGGNLCPELGGNNASAPQMPSTWLPSPVLRDPDCLLTPCPASQMHSLSCTKSLISATKRYSSEKYGAAEIMKRKRPVNGLSR